MSSPFPGMDPYLENPLLWRSFHGAFATNIAAQLNVCLPPGYRASPEERVYVETHNRNIYPDGVILQRIVPQTPVLPRRSFSGVAVIDPADAPETLFLPMERKKEWRVVVLSPNPKSRIVTVIELLSPANKAAGSDGRREYLQKQDEILRSDANLLEIDLQRGGSHTVAAPREELSKFGSWDYLVVLSCVLDRQHIKFWRNGVRRRLPCVPIPLVGEDEDILLDLQAAFNQTYNGLRLEEAIDYNEPPFVPLEGEDAKWADALLREKGLRGNSSESGAAQE